MAIDLTNLDELGPALNAAAGLVNATQRSDGIDLVMAGALLSIATTLKRIGTPELADLEDGLRYPPETDSTPRLLGIDESNEPVGRVPVGNLTAIIADGHVIAALADELSPKDRAHLLAILGAVEEPMSDAPLTIALASYDGGMPVRVKLAARDDLEGIAVEDTWREDDGRASVMVEWDGDNDGANRVWVDLLRAILEPPTPVVDDSDVDFVVPMAPGDMGDDGDFDDRD